MTPWATALAIGILVAVAVVGAAARRLGASKLDLFIWYDVGATCAVVAWLVGPGLWLFACAILSIGAVASDIYDRRREPPS